LRAEGFFCSLDVLYGGIGIGKLQVFIKVFLPVNKKKVVIKTLDPDWIRIRIRIGTQPKMLDLDPDQRNTDPIHCC
jgi:hypothetical protein